MPSAMATSGMDSVAAPSLVWNRALRCRDAAAALAASASESGEAATAVRRALCAAGDVGTGEIFGVVAAVPRSCRVEAGQSAWPVGALAASGEPSLCPRSGGVGG
jgi:hypothetical protein